MTTCHKYTVGGFCFIVELPEDQNALTLLPSFASFTGIEGECETIFRMVTGDIADSREMTLIEKNSDDIGDYTLYSADDGYMVEISHPATGVRHRMLMDRKFTSSKADIRWEDRYAGNILSSMLRIMFSLSAIYHRAFSIHASTVVKDGKAYLFTGKSGTGKSTHSSLWIKHIPGCTLLNDDDPMVRLENGEVITYGTPWSGKTPCYRNESYETGGIVRLFQAPYNRFTPKHDVDAFSCMLPGCSVIDTDKALFETLCDTLAEVAGKVRAGILECRPDSEAALICFEKITENIDTK